MRFTFILSLIFGTSPLLRAQVNAAPDAFISTAVYQFNLPKDFRNQHFRINFHHKSQKQVNQDSTLYNRYGNLLNDDPTYNPQQPFWKPAAQVIGVNLLFMGFNRYLAKADYGFVNLNTWRNNINSSPEWDTDQFGINFIGHPYQGTLYYNTARAQGFNF